MHVYIHMYIYIYQHLCIHICMYMQFWYIYIHMLPGCPKYPVYPTYGLHADLKGLKAIISGTLEVQVNVLSYDISR